MTDYGNSLKYVAVISDAISGSPSAPSGTNKCYLWSRAWENIRDNKLKYSHLLDGTTVVTIKGKKFIRTQIEDWVILDDDGQATTNTQSLNNKTDYLDSISDVDSSPHFMIIASDIDSVNVHLSYNQDYAKGYVMNFRFKPLGNVYVCSFDWLEAIV